ncbi:DUF1992 domain-containing protein [Desulfitobacterium sp. Sab5]|uniref:DnaJ family domain-containing protein n=1 Tax=Desulfitobacterium nosdiversum TaxID=3375356 RepID=UPI003CED2F15
MFDKIVEEKIQEAIRKGEFDNLPKRGKINLDDWARLPEDIRIGYTLLKNAGYVPEEVQLLKEIEELRKQLAGSNTQDEKAVISKKLTETELKYNLTMELRNRRR